MFDLEMLFYTTCLWLFVYIIKRSGKSVSLSKQMCLFHLLLQQEIHNDIQENCLIYMNRTMKNSYADLWDSKQRPEKRENNDKSATY